MRKTKHLSELLVGLPHESKDAVGAAYVFAQEHLSSLHRRSGEGYAEHGCEVACTLKELTQDASLLSVALLHDILVHPEGDRLLRMSPLTARERSIVRAMHGLRRLHIDASTKDLDTVIDAFASDERLLPLRMAHRLNDVRHLARFAPKLRREIAHEALHMYTAIAGRLGMYAWRYEMEDLCFSYLQPSVAKHLRRKFDAHASLDDACLSHASRFLLRALKRQGIEATMERRIKSLYSTYRKMVLKRRRFEEVMDRLALRILVDDLPQCYLALGVVHASMHPVPGKLKDYIGAPKENGYQSIHTVVFPLPGVTEQPMEIQIRARAMHEACEYGAASHGTYKNYVYSLRSRPARVHLFRNLEGLRQEARSPRQFEQALREYFRADRMIVFDSANNLYHVRKPATALDFVCIVHGKRVRMLKAVKINGRARAFDTPLHDGDTVEASFGRSLSFSGEWRTCVRHASSRSLLRTLVES